MPKEDLDNGILQTRLDEPAEYLRRRDELRLLEIESMKLRERVAEMRRNLPKSVAVQDYVFLAGPDNLNDGDEPVKEVRLSELFTGPNRSLVIYQMMYGKQQKHPCPMCTMFVDALNGVSHHITQNADFAVVTAADPKTLRAFARTRGWNNLRLLSAPESSTFKYDMGSEDREGNQDSCCSVFTKDEDGTLRHFYTVHPRLSPEIKERGEDLLVPVYNVLDLVPQGRGEWYASLKYSPRLMTQ